MGYHWYDDAADQLRSDATGAAVGVAGDLIVVSFNATGLPGDSGIIFGINDLTVQAQKGTDLSVIDASQVPNVNAGAVIQTETGGSFGISCIYNVRLTALDSGSSELRVASVTVDYRTGPDSTDLYSYGMDTATALVLNKTFTDGGTAQPFTDVAAGGWLGGQMAAFIQNGRPGDVFNINGRFTARRIA